MSQINDNDIHVYVIVFFRYKVYAHDLKVESPRESLEALKVSPHHTLHNPNLFVVYIPMLSSIYIPYYT